MRGIDLLDEEIVCGIIDKLFFFDKWYNFGEVGWYKINCKLELEIIKDMFVFIKEDIILIVIYLV